MLISEMKPGKTYQVFLQGEELPVAGFFLDYVFYEGFNPAWRVGFIEPRSGIFFRHSLAELLPRHERIGVLKGLTLFGASGLMYRLVDDTDASENTEYERPFLSGKKQIVTVSKIAHIVSDT